MKKTLLYFFIFLLAVAPAFAQKPYAEGQLMVQVSDKQYSMQEAITMIENQFSSFDLQQNKKLSEPMKIHLFTFNPAKNEHQLLDEVRKHPMVLNAQFNHRVKLREATEDTIPNDPEFGELWGLHNTGQTGGVEDADIDAPEAWVTTRGGITVLGDTIVTAIVDGGLAYLHEDLDSNMWRNYNEIPDNDIDDDGNGYVDDIYGWNAYNSTGSIPGDSHGTHVAGTVSARGGNEIGVTGVNWYAQLMAIAASSGFENTVIEGYSYVLEMRTRYNVTDGEEGAFVVSTNASFGVDQGDPEDYPLWGAIYDSLGKQGVLSAAATANASWDIDEVGDVPTAFESPFLLSVTNTTDEDEKYNAGYGVTTIDLGAPGTSVYSTTPNDNYGYKTGTSMATPHVTGALALLFAAADSAMMETYKTNPDSIALLIRDYLLFNTDPLPSLEGITVSGGRLNVNNAIMAMDTLPVGPQLAINYDTLNLLLLPLQSDTSSLVLTNEGGGTINYTVAIPDSTDWITVSDEPGTLYSSETDSLNMVVDAATLPNGDYHGVFHVLAPDTNTVHVYITVGLDTDNGESIAAKETTLEAAPNPFSNMVSFTLETPHSLKTTVDIYNLSGRKVATLLDREVSGKTTITWNGTANGRKLPDGIYIVRATNNHDNITKKVVMQR